MARAGLKNIRKLIDNAKKSLPPEQEFVADLKRSIEMTEDKNRGKPSNYYKPSSMNCIRNMYYTRTSADIDDTGSSYSMWGICNSGTDIHERVQRAVDDMKNNGIDCEYVDVADFVKQRGLNHLTIISKNGMETKLRDENLKLSFLCDGIIRYKSHYYILELKTESASKWYNREGVDPKHYHQGTAYSIEMQLPEVLFVYINRDIFDMKGFMFVPTDDMKQDLIGQIDECESYVSRMIAPPKPENLPKMTCEWCAYKEICRKT